MRKRTIISIILVLVILGLSHNVWLTIRPKPQSTVTSIRGGGGSSSTEINRLLTLRSRVSIKFDAMIFIIIAILGFMLSYKLTSYLADFKVEKKIFASGYIVFSRLYSIDISPNESYL